MSENASPCLSPTLRREHEGIDVYNLPVPQDPSSDPHHSPATGRPNRRMPMNPTLRALLAIVLFTYTAQNMLNASIAPLSRALGIPGWVVGAAVSLAAVTVATFSQFWGRRSISWGRRRVLLLALILALIAGSLFSGAVLLRSFTLIGPLVAGGAIMIARGPFFGAAVAAIPPTGQALIAEATPDGAARVAGISAFSGAIQLSIMIGSLISSALGAWWIYGPVHATPVFIAIALVIGVVTIPKDGPARAMPTSSKAASQRPPAALPPKVRWTDPRVLPWILGIFGIFFANGVVQITMGFLVQDRLGLSPQKTVSITALMLLANAAGGMLMQLIVVPRSALAPKILLRLGMSVGFLALIALSLVSSAPLLALATFILGAANGLASPGFSAGASLAVSDAEQGGVAGVVNATGALTWIFAPVSATALYDWNAASPFLLTLGLFMISLIFAWRVRTGEAERLK